MSRRATTVLCGALAVGLVIVFAVCHADPIPDSDLFWHMAYARQMLERGTLQLDHTAFSWTPASNRMIYCAWLAELALYGLWERVGPWSVFALRYAVVAATIALLWDFARRLGLARQPIVYLVLLVVLLAQTGGTMLKPELFSLLCFHLVVGAYFRGKLATRDGRSAAPWLYLVPAIVLVWVNAHGAFILAAPFLAATALGEIVQFSRGRETSLASRDLRHLLAAWMFSGLATVLTPYGWRYPSQLVEDYVLGATPRPDMVWNAAHRTVWQMSGPGLDYLELGALMAVLLVAVTILRLALRPRAVFDPVPLLVNVAYVPLFFLYLRSAWLWAPVFGYGFLWMAADLRSARDPSRVRSWLSALHLTGALASAVLGTRALWSATYYRAPNTWLGFGISTWNPVPEAEFLAASPLGPHVLNLFNTGGYLLWRLAPRYQVMTDARSFPYLAWFDDLHRFTRGDDFDAFLAAHPADVAVIDHAQEPVWRQFLRTPAWRLAYYGPTASVFVPASVDPSRLAADVAPTRFAHLRSATAAFGVFDFALAVGDYATAWTVEHQLDTSLRSIADPRRREAAARYRDAHRALRDREYERAAALFHETLDRRPVSDRERLIQTLLADRDTARRSSEADQVAVFDAALAKLVAPQ